MLGVSCSSLFDDPFCSFDFCFRFIGLRLIDFFLLYLLSSSWIGCSKYTVLFIGSDLLYSHSTAHLLRNTIQTAMNLFSSDNMTRFSLENKRMIFFLALMFYLWSLKFFFPRGMASSSDPQSSNFLFPPPPILLAHKSNSLYYDSFFFTSSVFMTCVIKIAEKYIREFSSAILFVWYGLLWL